MDLIIADPSVICITERRLCAEAPLGTREDLFIIDIRTGGLHCRLCCVKGCARSRFGKTSIPLDGCEIVDRLVGSMLQAGGGVEAEGRISIWLIGQGRIQIVIRVMCAALTALGLMELLSRVKIILNFPAAAVTFLTPVIYFIHSHP